MKAIDILNSLGIDGSEYSTTENAYGVGRSITSYSPIDGSVVGSLKMHSAQEILDKISVCNDAFEKWKTEAKI